MEYSHYSTIENLIAQSNSFDNLRRNIRLNLSTERNIEMIELYITWDYQIQITQNVASSFGLPIPKWDCISAIAGGAVAGGIIGAGVGVGTVIPGLGTASGAVIGSVIGGTIAGIKNCR